MNPTRAKEHLDQLKTEEEKRKVLIESAQKSSKDSLYFFSKKILGYTDINARTHGRIIDCLSSDGRRKLIVCPRGAFKSSIGVVAYSLWLLIKNPNLRIMIDSETYNNSKNFLREIKSHLQSPLMREIFGDSVGSDWTEGTITLKQRTKPYKESSITCAGIGVVKVGQHYDVIIHDDMNSNKNSGTPEACKKITEHYRLNLSILEPSGVMVVIGTRYSNADLIQFILDNEVNDERV